MSATRPARVSAVVPCFNVGPILSETVDSLRAQTEPPFEIVIVDDCSTDPLTLETLDRLERLPGVRVHRKPTNDGISVVRNVGIDLVEGDATLFLDGDDLLNPEAIAAMADALGANPEAGFAYTAISCFGNRDDTLDVQPFNPYLLHQVNFCTSASLVRRTVFEAGFRFDVRAVARPEDWDFWLQISAAGFVGTPAEGATLLYRRTGFTRTNLVNAATASMLVAQIESRPELYDADRLAELKRTHAPAVSIITDEAIDALPWQTTGDVELACDAPPRGKLLVVPLAPLATVFAHPLTLERIIAAHETNPAVAVSGLVRREALHAAVPSLEEVSWPALRPGFGHEDIVALCLRVQGFADALGERPARDLRTDALAAALAQVDDHPTSTTLLAGPGAPRSTGLPDPRVLARDAVPAAGWSDALRSRMPAALPWRLAGGAATLLDAVDPPSAFALVHGAETDGAGDWTLYRENEALPAGMVARRPEVTLHAESTYGGVPLVRAIHPPTGTRTLWVGDPAADHLAEAYLGDVEHLAVPGGAPLAVARGGGHASLGWAFRPTLSGATRPGAMSGPWPVLWRAADDLTGRHRYGTDPARLSRGARVEGPVCRMLPWPLEDANAVPIFLVAEDDRAPVGVATAVTAAAHGLRAVGAPIGALSGVAADGLRPIWLSVDQAGDLLCSNLRGEGREIGYRELALLGHARSV